MAKAASSTVIYYSDEQKRQALKGKAPVKAVKAKSNRATKIVKPQAVVKEDRRQSPRLAKTSPQQPSSVTVVRQQQQVKTVSRKPSVGAGGGGTMSKLDKALETARAIAQSGHHPNQADVQALLHSYEKGWITAPRFLDVLPTLLFN